MTFFKHYFLFPIQTFIPIQTLCPIQTLFPECEQHREIPEKGPGLWKEACAVCVRGRIAPEGGVTGGQCLSSCQGRAGLCPGKWELLPKKEHMRAHSGLSFSFCPPCSATSKKHTLRGGSVSCGFTHELCQSQRVSPRVASSDILCSTCGSIRTQVTSRTIYCCCFCG